MSTLSDDLRTLVADQPGVPDWPGLVRGRVARRRRRLLAATVAAVVLLAGGGFALAGQGGRATLVPAATPTPSPTPSLRPTADERNRVVVFLDLDVTRVPADVPVDLVVVARGFTDGTPEILQVQVDGQQEGPDSVPACAGPPPGESPPAPQPQQTEVRQTVTRTFSQGTHVVVVRAASGCAVLGGSDERSYLITAEPADGTPTQPVEVFLDPEVTEVKADVPVELVVVARGFGESPVAVLELLVDGFSLIPDPALACMPPPSQPPPRRATEARRTFARTFGPGRHVVTVRADAVCSYYRGSATRNYLIVAKP